MMFYPPFMSFPFNRRYHSFYAPPYTQKLSKTPVLQKNNFSTSNKQSSSLPISKENITKSQEYSQENSQVFSILGITLHFDDILIVCLLFFLYSEGVQDEMLFMALILLLLT